MADFASALWNKPAAAADSTPADPVTRSLRFDGSSYLSFTPSTATTTRQKAVINFWFKLAEPKSSSTRNTYLFTAGTVQGSPSEWFGINYDASTSKLTIGAIFGSGGGATTEAVFRDYSSWYNLHLIVDTTESLNSNKYKLYINGVLQTLTGTFPTLNSNLHIGSDKPHRFGWQTSSYHGTTYSPQVYIANAYLLENSTLPFTDFIEDTGFESYKPKATSGLTFGTNGFHIDAQPAHDAELLVSSIDRNDGDTDFADAAKGHTVTSFGDPEHSTTVGNPFDSSGTAISFDGTGDYLSVATSSDFDFGSGSYTYEGWFYFNGFSETPDGIFSRNNSSTQKWAVCTNSSGTLQFFESVNNSYNTSSFTFSTGQWYHIALCKNGTTYKVYVDGSEKISATLSSAPDANLPVIIGRFYDNYNGYYLDGYCFDFRAQKGVDTGGSAPTAPLELNPVYIGGDQSGNKNHFQPTNISTTDIRTDVPTDSFCVMSPVDKGSGVTLSEGNLKAVCDNNWDNVRGTMGATSGKFYYEVVGNIAHSTRWNAGVDINQKCQVDTYNNNTGSIVYSLYDGKIYDGAGSYSSATQDQSETNARIGVAVDIDAGKVWFRFNNGSWELSGGDPTSESSSGSVTFTANSLVQPLFAGYGATFAAYFQESEWTDTAPTDYGEWKTSRLDTPTVTPSENFEIAQWVGNETAGKVISTDISPDLVWIKNRDVAKSHTVGDSVRGANKALLTNSDNSESTSANNITAFDTDASGGYSFTLGASEKVNDSDKNHVGWVWKAHQGGSTSYSNTLTLDVRDNYGGGSGWGTTKLEVWEGSTKLTDITNPPSSSSKIYNIKTNDLDKIKIVWYVDGSAGDWYNMYAVLKNSSNTTLASWDGNSWSGNSSDAPSDDDNFYLPSSFDSTNAATTGVVEAADAGTERYNSSAGFSIITYTGNGSTDGDTQEITHTLGAEPEFIIAKSRSSSSSNGTWNVYHKHAELSTSYGYGTHGYLRLDENYAASEPYYDILIPKSGSENTIINTVYNSSDGLYTNQSGVDYVMYAWAPVEGYSKFGKYTGASSGPFIYFGFRPKFFMYKQSTGSTNWVIVDAERETHNTVDLGLFPNLSTNEQAGSSSNYKMDFLSNGVKIRTSASGTNANNQTFIYAAFAESPFKHANAR